DIETEQEYRDFKRTQIELMRSKSMLVRALRDPAIYNLPFVRGQDDPVEWLQENLKFDYPNDAELLRIRLWTSSPEEGIKVVDAVIDLYFKEVVEKGIIERAKAEQKLREIRQYKNEELVRDRKDLVGLRRNLGEDARTS